MAPKKNASEKPAHDKQSRDDAYRAYYGEMGIVELRGVCEAQGKSKGGSKEDIINRLLQRDAPKKESPQKSRSQSPPVKKDSPTKGESSPQKKESTPKKKESTPRKSSRPLSCPCCSLSYCEGEKKSILVAGAILASFVIARYIFISRPSKEVMYLDVGQAVGVCMWAIWLRNSGRDPFLFDLFLWGTFLGAVFEFGFDHMGDGFHTVLIADLKKPWWMRGVCHSLSDGALFCIGVWLCRDFSPKPHFLHFSIQELGIMLVWGAVQAIVVELCYNGWVWSYPAGHKFNPIMFHWGKIPYTLAPQLTWFVFPCIFYMGLLELWKHYLK